MTKNLLHHTLITATRIRRARLIPGWSMAWRLWSVRIAALGAGLMTAWSSLPPDLRAMLPCSDRMAAGLFLTVTMARLIAQDDPASGQASGEDAA